jgi:hypothetical protein
MIPTEMLNDYEPPLVKQSFAAQVTWNYFKSLLAYIVAHRQDFRSW